MKSSNEELKQIVRKKYAAISQQSKGENEQSCCSTTGCATVDYSVFADDYTEMKGYNPDADLGLGCGIPTEFAQIKAGDVVVDLGSGVGNDCFIAREITGASGKVIGVDMTPEMIDKARINADKLGFNNVEFRLGDIESLPIGGNVADVVVSNCVLNLVPDKKLAFSEMFRILKQGAHFSVSDVVLKGELPPQLNGDAELYAGCVSGAIQEDEYLLMLHQTGFENIKVQKKKRINLPEKILKNYFDDAQIEAFYTSDIGIFSITVFGQKPENCGEGSGCC